MSKFYICDGVDKEGKPIIREIKARRPLKRIVEDRPGWKPPKVMKPYPRHGA